MARLAGMCKIIIKSINSVMMEEKQFEIRPFLNELFDYDTKMTKEIM